MRSSYYFLPSDQQGFVDEDGQTIPVDFMNKSVSLSTRDFHPSSPSTSLETSSTSTVCPRCAPKKAMVFDLADTIPRKTQFTQGNFHMK